MSEQAAKPKYVINIGTTPTTALVPAALMGFLLIVIIQIASIILVVLSFIGSMAGIQSHTMPLSWDGFTALFNALGLVGILLQFVLSVAQWGSRALIREDRRWWWAYLAALGLSAYFNWICYSGILMESMGMPWLLAVVVIVGADVLPEVVLLREE